MEEQHYTIAIFEHSDRHGRFVAYEIEATGQRTRWIPASATRPNAHHRECIFFRTRVANPVPDSWQRIHA